MYFFWTNINMNIILNTICRQIQIWILFVKNLTANTNLILSQEEYSQIYLNFLISVTLRVKSKSEISMCYFHVFSACSIAMWNLPVLSWCSCCIWYQNLEFACVISMCFLYLVSKCATCKCYLEVFSPFGI